MDWDKGNFYVGPIVEEEFLAEDTYRHSVGYRGPYISYGKYLKCLTKVKTEATLAWLWETCEARSPESPDCNEVQAFPTVVGALTSRLLATINKVYHAETPRGNGPFHGSFAYFQHEDLHVGNVLVGDPGEETMVKAIIDWGGCRVAPHFMRRSQGVPTINEVFVAEEFLRADTFNMEAFEMWLSMKTCFALRPIVQELMPEDKHVSVSAMVLHLWYRQVKRMDPRVSLDLEPVEALDTFVNHFVRRGFSETRTFKTFMAALNDSEDDDLATGVF